MSQAQQLLSSGAQQIMVILKQLQIYMHFYTAEALINHNISDA